MILPAACATRGSWPRRHRSRRRASRRTPRCSRQVTDLIGKLQAGLIGLKSAVGHHGAADVLAEAKHFATSVLPAMLKVRDAADGSRRVVDDLWPLPTYQEMLFIK